MHENKEMKKLIFLLALASCTEAVPPVPPISEDTCNAARYTDLIGQDATALEKIMLLGKVRVIRPGQAVTMDFLQDRVNFVIDEGNDIASIRCG